MSLSIYRDVSKIGAEGLRRRWRRCSRRTAVATAGLLAFGIAVAACGGGPSTPGVATGSTTTIASSSAGGGHPTGMLAYSSCMRSHGVPNFPDPNGSGGIPKQSVISAFGAVSSAQANTAQNDCKHLLPAGGSLSGKPVQTVTAQDEQYYLKVASCMRSHGITNFPDPVFSNGQVELPLARNFNTRSTQFTGAKQICQKLIPAGLPYSGSGG